MSLKFSAKKNKKKLEGKKICYRKHEHCTCKIPVFCIHFLLTFFLTSFLWFIEDGNNVKRDSDTIFRNPWVRIDARPSPSQIDTDEIGVACKRCRHCWSLWFCSPVLLSSFSSFFRLCSLQTTITHSNRGAFVSICCLNTWKEIELNSLLIPRTCRKKTDQLFLNYSNWWYRLIEPVETSRSFSITWVNWRHLRVISNLSLKFALNVPVSQ